jgi:hypothetical protein
MNIEGIFNHLNLSLIPFKQDLMQSLANGMYEAQYQI